MMRRGCAASTWHGDGLGLQVGFGTGMGCRNTCGGMGAFLGVVGGAKSQNLPLESSPFHLLQDEPQTPQVFMWPLLGRGEDRSHPKWVHWGHWVLWAPQGGLHPPWHLGIPDCGSAPRLTSKPAFWERNYPDPAVPPP